MLEYQIGNPNAARAVGYGSYHKIRIVSKQRFCDWVMKEVTQHDARHIDATVNTVVLRFSPFGFW